MGSFVILLLVLGFIVDIPVAWTQIEEAKVLRGFRRVPEARMIGIPRWHRRGGYKITVGQARPKTVDVIEGEAAALELLKEETVNKSHSTGAKESDSPITAILKFSDDKHILAGELLIPLNPDFPSQNLSSVSNTSAERNEESVAPFTSGNARSTDSAGQARSNHTKETHIEETADGRSDKPKGAVVQEASAKDSDTFNQLKNYVEGTSLKSNASSSSSVTVNTRVNDTLQTSKKHTGGEEKSVMKISVSEQDKKVDEADSTSSHLVSEENLVKRNLNVTVSKMDSKNDRDSSEYLKNFWDQISETEGGESHFMINKTDEDPVTPNHQDIHFNFRNNYRSNIFLTVKIN